MPIDTVQVYEASGAEDIAAVLALFKEFVASLPISVDFQNVDAEFATFPRIYDALILARVGGEAAGAVALKDLGLNTDGGRRCEMKRLYVRPEFRGMDIGAELSLQLMEIAARRGFEEMVLDSLERLGPALRLYERLGFKRIDAYYDNPEDDVVYMARALSPDITIRLLDSPQDLADARAMMQEFIDFAPMPLIYQNTGDEKANFPDPFILFHIARVKGEAAGIIAARDMGGGLIEMKRLWVRPEFRGLQLGDKLVHVLIYAARTAGFERMVLETLTESFNSAYKVYQRAGFTETDLFTKNPEPDVLCMGMNLKKQPAH